MSEEREVPPCCGAPIPQTAEEAQLMMICGLLNALCFFAIGNFILGAKLQSPALTARAVCQLISVFFLVGIIWCFIDGIVEILQGACYVEDCRPRQEHAKEQTCTSEKQVDTSENAKAATCGKEQPDPNNSPNREEV